MREPSSFNLPKQDSRSAWDGTLYIISIRVPNPVPTRINGFRFLFVEVSREGPAHNRF